MTQGKQAYTTALSARVTAEAEMKVFYDGFVSALTQALGPSKAGALPSFGVAQPRAPKPISPETRVIANARATATRVARGTKGKQQALAITASPEPRVQVLGADGEPIVPAAASAGTPAPSTTSTPATPVTPGHTT